MINESEKALRYIGLLESARLNGHWSEIQELTRKVDKHAPHRKCLTTTATSEAAIAHAASKPPSSASSSSSSSYTGLLDVTPKLVQVVDQEKSYFEDAFQANVCLHEIYFMRAEWNTLVANLDTDVWQQVAQHTKNPLDISPNTRIAILKNRYFLAVAHEQLGNPAAAAASYQSALRAVQDVPKEVSSASEYRVWAERIVSRACLLSGGQSVPSTMSQANTALIAFRNWANFWDVNPSKSQFTSSSRTPFDVSKRDTWGRYYNLLSSILATDLVYSSSPSTPLVYSSELATLEDLSAARRQQRAELKRVETVYETLMLQETHFPKAMQSNEEVERWVQQAVDNWQIFCGSRWREADLGEGGKVAVGRSMLDILYRAATKTFHSTPILRNLFIVHASLAEFDLAMQAFDTYSEIITKGKSRAEKSGEHEIGLDTDDLVVLTAAQAITILCKYGSRVEAEKAMDISKTLSTWLRQQRPMSDTSASPSLEKTSTETLLTRFSLAAAYRAIGQSQAHWARLTYETSQRKSLQATALISLRKAANLSTPPNSDPDTSVLLATVLAESRDYISAIQVLKKALALASQNQDVETDQVSADPEALTREQKLAPLWHLLSLLLTARGEYDNAVKVCEAAFEQLDGPDLFDSPTEQIRPTSANSQSVIDQMDDSVKKSLIQIRVTQLALMEILESPAAAVEASSTLLALFNKLFGAINAGAPITPIVSSQPPVAPLAVPKGTLKSISGSIMGRSRSRTNQSNMERQIVEKTAANTDGGASFGAPIAIQVTNEDGNPAAMNEKHHHHSHFPHHLPHAPFKLRGHHGDWREAGNLKQSAPNGTHTTETAAAPQQPLRQIPHNIDSEKQPNPISHAGQHPEQDLRLPAPHPAAKTSFSPRFLTTQQRRHDISLLVDIWLFTAGQYLRSELFEDAEGAIDEAHKLVDILQSELAKLDSSARAFDERGWGGGKSVNRLWADVYAERAVLATSHNRPHDALAHYEQSLSHFPDHPVAIVGISTILLDMYQGLLPAELCTFPPIPTTTGTAPKTFTPSSNTAPAPALTATSSSTPPKPPTGSLKAPSSLTLPSPAELNRLAARDRAFMLLNTLSQLGEGWDDSETWMGLARACELSGQVDRAKECLWWVVELEDGRPVRPWGVASGDV